MCALTDLFQIDISINFEYFFSNVLLSTFLSTLFKLILQTQQRPMKPLWWYGQTVMIYNALYGGSISPGLVSVCPWYLLTRWTPEKNNFQHLHLKYNILLPVSFGLILGAFETLTKSANMKYIWPSCEGTKIKIWQDSGRPVQISLILE